MTLSARDLSISDFTYDLPDDRIARHPAPVRDEARQLVYRNGEISEGIFRDLAERLPEGTLLIGNRTRVIHARLHFPLAEGKRPIEIFCLEPISPVDYAQSLGARMVGANAGESPVALRDAGEGTKVRWKCLVGGNRRWKRGLLQLETLVNGLPISLSVERGERLDNAFDIAFSWSGGAPDLTFGEVLSAAGNIPLPPYLGRDTEADDHDRYQTVFAKTEGSVAAPTAGLHFTPEVMASLAAKNIEWAEVTLHVGAGTFKPVDTPTLGGHTMHREYFEVSRKMIARLIKQIESGRPVVCVGTTSLRCIESLTYISETGKNLSDISVGQWVTEEENNIELNTLIRLQSILKEMDKSELNSISGHTGILLSPVSKINIADGIITNFHQPNSTLLLLISAFVGDDWKRIYEYALGNGFRFLSYGDSSLLWGRL